MRNWELRLGPIQIVMLIGIIIGSMICVYILGAYTGHKAGYELASEKNLKDAPKQLVFEEEGAEADANAAPSNLFAKLADDNENSESHPEVAPKLGAINAAEVVPADRTPKIVPLKKEDLKNEEEPVSDFAVQHAEAKTQAPTAATPAAGANVIRVLGAGRKDAEDSKTLGSLIQDQENEIKRQAQPTPVLVVTPPTPKSEPVHTGKAIVTFTDQKKPVVTPVVVKPTPVPETLIRSTLVKGWYAQVAAPKTQEDAVALAKQLKGAGFAVCIEKAAVRGEQYFRLVVGPEDNRQQAERLIGQLKRESAVKGDPFLRAVK